MKKNKLVSNFSEEELNRVFLPFFSTKCRSLIKFYDKEMSQKCDLKTFLLSVCNAVDGDQVKHDKE